MSINDGFLHRLQGNLSIECIRHGHDFVVVAN